MTSIWEMDTALSPRDALKQDLTCDVCVVGGGIAGVLTAHALQEAGLHVVLLEANRLLSGQTRHTTAKITAQHGLCYKRLIDTLGEERARAYAAANQRAVDAYRKLVQERHIDCGFEERDAYLYTQQDPLPLKEEADACRALGLDVSFTRETTLPFEVAGAACMRGQAQFHPLAFLKEIASRLTVYERSRASKIEEGCVYTDGGEVRARHVVLCTHFPFLNTPGYYFMRMHQERSYVLALENAPLPDGMFYGTDADGLSFRTSGPYLLLGGENHRTGENTSGGRYERLRQAAKRLYPHAREAAHWSAQDCMTLDGLPYAGRFSSATPDLYVATGFGKWGMTNAMASALLLRDLITGRECPYADAYSPQRFTPSASAKLLMEQTAQSFKGLARTAFNPPKAELDALPAGHGGIIDCGDEKLGAYKDEQGEVFLVSPVCPHLGCQLEWNADERTWDCPCHGSRFDHLGHLLDDPAQRGLETK